jgi:ATP-binding cassette subfamily B protein/subfamily B ATP-binding cassette protein MsbA
MAGDRNTMKMDPARVDGKMEFRDVSFRYSETAELALEDLNLTVQAGQTVALVGPSGAGKTTLTNLIARFYNPTSGQILIDGQDLRDYDVESYRSILGVVEQDVFLFEGTVARNIAYSKRLATEAEIRAAADAANATEFIERLPDGFQTRIGERGFKLSGGQRQRLAIARAILADPTLLILDEATSNLDTESEQLIQRSLKRLTDKRTCFVIAHRLSTIADADLICVIENGRITQTGTHAELMQSGGRYRTMVEQQISLALGENPLRSLRPTEQKLPAPHS